MATPKHTSGPWKAIGGYVYTADDDLICCPTTTVNDDLVVDGKANARLIAAAPQLLEFAEFMATVHTILGMENDVVTRLRENAANLVEQATGRRP